MMRLMLASWPMGEPYCGVGNAGYEAVFKYAGVFPCTGLVYLLKGLHEA